MKQLLLVGIFGACGAMARFALSVWLFRATGDVFPLATLIVNVLGCGAIGLVFRVSGHLDWLPAEWRIAIVAGFLGGLTTFSTFGFETVRLIELGRFLLAAANILANVCLGLAAVFGGMAVGRWLID